MLKDVVGIDHKHFVLTVAQALLGAYIYNVSRAFSFMLWHILRGLANWHIWKARNTLVMKKIHVPTFTIKIKVWKELYIYIYM